MLREDHPARVRVRFASLLIVYSAEGHRRGEGSTRSVSPRVGSRLIRTQPRPPSTRGSPPNSTSEATCLCGTGMADHLSGERRLFWPESA